MGVRDFLRALLESGRVKIAGAAAPRAEELAECDDLLRLAADRAGLEMAGAAPEVVLPVARWGLERVYCGCQCLMYREIPAEVVLGAMAEPCPEVKEASGPAIVFSADLVLRYLPDLWRMARGLAEGDPLVAGLQKLGQEWPLSSVGMTGVGPVEVGAFWAHAGLRQLYVDRVLERGDAERLRDQRVLEAARAAVGMYPELAGRLREKISTTENTEDTEGGNRDEINPI